MVDYYDLIIIVAGFIFGYSVHYLFEINKRFTALEPKEILQCSRCGRKTTDYLIMEDNTVYCKICCGKVTTRLEKSIFLGSG